MSPRRLDRPFAILVSPPVYDFALFDLFLKPFALLRIAKWLASAGWGIRVIDCLDYRDPMTLKSRKKPRRRDDGTGKFFRTPVGKPSALKSVPRRFARYGIEKHSLEEQLRRLTAESVSLVLIGSGMTYWYPGLKEALDTVKRVFPQVPVVVGGVYVSLCPDHCRKVVRPDFLVVGDAYPALEGILDELDLPHPTGPPDDSLFLHPASLLDAAPIRLNRGCPYRCDYCASYLLCGEFVPGDAARCFKSLREIHKRLGTTRFAFYDDALLVDKQRALIPFLERVIDSALPLAFYTPNGLHVREIDAEVAGLMKRAGFRDIRLGFESGSDDFHRRHGRKLEVSMLESSIDALRAGGFRQITVYVLSGLPGQYADEVEESIRFASRFRVRVELAGYSPIPGAPLWAESARLSRYPLEEEPLTHNNSIHPMEWKGFTLADRQRLKQLTHSFSTGPDSPLPSG